MTIIRTISLGLPIFCLAACNLDLASSQNSTKQLPEEVLNIVGPNQNLAAVEVSPEDNCYWFQHSNAVETTLLPLRTKSGAHICIKQEEAETEVAEAS